MSNHLETARQYLAALERGADAATIGTFLHPDVVATEFPNRIAPLGQRRNRTQMLDGVERGRKLLSAQTYAITSAVAVGDNVILEVDWSGTLAVPFGDQLPAGATLRANLAMFLEFKDGQVVASRHYDCYEPWGAG